MSTQEGVAPDPYWQAALDAKATEHSIARVSVTTGRALEYGEIKCTVTVSIDCPQAKNYMDKAAELAFKAAVEYTNDGMSILVPNLPPLQVP